ncbi:MAG: hypothetical protein ACJAXR_000518 [Halopseudomonas sp.]|jgi:hypothetical protein
MKVINTKVAHSASVACGITLSVESFFFYFVIIIPNILAGSFRLLHFATLLIGFLIFFCFGYIICRFMLLILYPIYLWVSKTLSIIIFILVGALVPIMTVYLIGPVYTSALDAPFSMDYKSMLGHIVFGFFGSCCAISAWYVLRKHEPNNTLQRTSR